MRATAGEAFTATVPVPAGTWDGYGAQVEVPVTGEVVSPWLAAVLERHTPDGWDDWGDQPTRWEWACTQVAPATGGDYQLVWRTEDGRYPNVVPLFVDEAAVDVTGFPPPDEAEVTPDVEDVAALMRTRTVTEGGSEDDVATFTEDTYPTGDAVEALIGSARMAVLMALPETFDPVHNEQVRHLVTLYAAMLTEGSFFREQVDDSGVDLWRTLYANGIAALKDRMDRDQAQASLLGGMEPRAAA